MRGSMKKNKKEFVLPTHFELILRRKDKDGLEPIIKWLLANPRCTFQWNWKMLERDEEFTLSIQIAWADNLVKIGKLLGDYKQD